jgi:hypothetical protein
MSDLRLSDFVSLFDYTSCKVVEKFNDVVVILQASSYKTLDAVIFENALGFLNSRDRIQISIMVDDGEPSDYYSGDDPLDFVQEFNNKLSVVDEEPITIAVKITKTLDNGTLSIYCYKEFLAFLQGLSIQAILHEFYQYVQKLNSLRFEFQSQEIELKTESIWFVNKNHHGSPERIDRQSSIEQAKTSCYYNFLGKLPLLPDDFYVIEKNSTKLEVLFTRLSAILSIVLLYDITQIHDDTLEYRLNGYKSLNGSVDLSLLKPDPENQYFQIYSWVYQSGNFVDKLGLARNIISLHLSAPTSITLSGDPFRSIQSSYKVYEKQNIKQYIEIRNKIFDQLLSFHDRANKIIETFALGFQKSALALVTFYTSAIILKVLTKDKLVEVFTIDASVLSTAFIACSVFYYFVLTWELRVQRKRFANNYKAVKIRYLDLLDEQDINRILNNDSEFTGDLAFIDAKGIMYTRLWFSFLALFLVVTWLLYFVYQPVVFEELTYCVLNSLLRFPMSYGIFLPIF